MQDRDRLSGHFRPCFSSARAVGLRRLMLAAAGALTLTAGSAAAQTPTPSTPPHMPTDLSPEGVRVADEWLALEQVDGAEAMAFVAQANRDSLAVLTGDPRYETFRAQALEILTAQDRIPTPAFLGDGVANFWQDAEHPKGVWRWTTLDSYRSDSPEWQILLDLDRVARDEGRDWVWKGAQCLPPEDQLCLISLSDGGGDAVVVREFLVPEVSWVTADEQAFFLPEGKHRTAWLADGVLLVATDFGPEADGGPTLTESGYPYIVRQLQRGEALTAAETMFSGDVSDGGYGVNPTVHRGPEGEVEAIIVSRPLDTFRSETWLLVDAEPIRLNLPERVTIWGTRRQGDIVTLIFSVDEDWSFQDQSYGAGSLLGVNLDLLRADATNSVVISNASPLILQPTARQSVDSVAITRDRVVVALYDNVIGQLRSFEDRGEWGWPETIITVPDNSSVALVDAGRSSNDIYYSVEGFLTPTTLMTADAAVGGSQPRAGTRTLDAGEIVAQLPARFGASTHVVEQFQATSSDGTLIPYFLVRPRDLAMTAPARPLCTATAASRFPSPPTTSPRWAGCGWRAAASS